MPGYWQSVAEGYCRPTDSSTDRERKHVLVPVFLIAGPPALMWGLYDVASGTYDLALAGLFAFGAGALAVVGVMKWTQWDLERVLTAHVLMSTLGTVCLDWDAAARGASRHWPWFTVVVVAARLLRLSVNTVRAGIAVLAVWIAVESADHWSRFGLLDVPGFGADREMHLCACVDPPCALPMYAVVSHVVKVSLLMLAVCLASQLFAAFVSQQLCLVEASVSITEQVTAALSKYEVDVAEAVVAGEEGEKLPEGLRASLAVLLDNLKAYKPYLPHSCLVSDASFLEDSVEPAEQSPCCDGSPGHSSRSSASDRKPSLAGPRAEPKRKATALLCSNRTRFCEFVGAADLSTVSEWISREVRIACAVMGPSHGVVDLVNGDHMFASFNASRNCVRCTHRAVSASMAMSRARKEAECEGEMSFTVVSGSSVCGDFGCVTMQRFMIVGHLASSLLLLERLSAKWGLRSAVDEATFKDTHMHFQYDLRGACVLLKLASERLRRVYDLTGIKQAPATEEWMYELASLGGQSERTLEQVSSWVDQLQDGHDTEEELRAHFKGGPGGVVVVTDVGLEDYGEWRRRRAAEWELPVLPRALPACKDCVTAAPRAMPVGLIHSLD